MARGPEGQTRERAGGRVTVLAWGMCAFGLAHIALWLRRPEAILEEARQN